MKDFCFFTANGLLYVFVTTKPCTMSIFDTNNDKLIERKKISLPKYFKLKKLFERGVLIDISCL